MILFLIIYVKYIIGTVVHNSLASYIRVDDNLEVDLVIERHGLPTFIIEIKSTDNVNETHIKAVSEVSKSIKNIHNVNVSHKFHQ